MMNVNDKRRANITTIMNQIGSCFSRDMVMEKFGECMADKIAIMVQEEIGFKMLVFSNYCISVDDLSMKLMDKIIALLFVPEKCMESE